MEQEPNATLRRTQIKAIFRSNKGSVTRLARELGIKHPGVSAWLKGKITSERIAKAAQQMAIDLQQQAEKTESAA